MFDNDGEIVFASEEDESIIHEEHLKYKLLIVDDEQSVHDVTTLVLDDMSFQDRKLEILHAYSAKEGEEILSRESDIAVILLDVVMETDTAGLDLVEVIRKKLKNDTIRIILRTGQPGHAPEEDVIVNYDINDYKNKTELTTEKLFSSIVTALRSYSDLVKIKRNKVGLEKVLNSTSSVINLRSIDKFFGGLLEQVLSLIHDESVIEPDGLSVYLAFFKKTNILFNVGTGIFEDEESRNDKVFAKYEKELKEAVRAKDNIKTKECFILYHLNEDSNAILMLFDGDISNICIEDDLLNIYIRNIAITYDNLLKSEDIKESQKDTIFMLSELAEQRSRETGKHVKRVAYFAKEIALEIGLSDNEVEEIFTSAPMHDIGKIAISDMILKKPGKLTDEEFTIMKEHAQIGYEILKNSDKKLMRVASVVAQQHHERYDGKGYPRGLVADEIHIYAQITALCDVFDALGSKRVYKDAWPIDKVLELIKSERAKQFDPKVVDAFFARIDNILNIMEEHKDC